MTPQHIALAELVSSLLPSNIKLGSENHRLAVDYALDEVNDSVQEVSVDQKKVLSWLVHTVLFFP